MLISPCEAPKFTTTRATVFTHRCTCGADVGRHEAPAQWRGSGQRGAHREVLRCDAREVGAGDVADDAFLGFWAVEDLFRGEHGEFWG